MVKFIRFIALVIGYPIMAFSFIGLIFIVYGGRVSRSIALAIGYFIMALMLVGFVGSLFIDSESIINFLRDSNIALIY